MGTRDELLVAVAARYRGATRTSKVYLPLERATGRVLGFDALAQAMAFGPLNPPSRSNFAGAIAKLR